MTLTSLPPIGPSERAHRVLSEIQNNTSGPVTEEKVVRVMLAALSAEQRDVALQSIQRIAPDIVARIAEARVSEAEQLVAACLSSIISSVVSSSAEKQLLQCKRWIENRLPSLPENEIGRVQQEYLNIVLAHITRLLSPSEPITNRAEVLARCSQPVVEDTLYEMAQLCKRLDALSGDFPWEVVGILVDFSQSYFDHDSGTLVLDTIKRNQLQKDIERLEARKRLQTTQ